MNDLNQVSLTGRLTDDADLQETSAGNPVLNFRLAVNRQAGESTEQTSYFDVSTFGPRCHWLAGHLKRGTVVAVGGRLEQQRWTSANGVKQNKVAVIATVVRIVDGFRGCGDGR